MINENQDQSNPFLVMAVNNNKKSSPPRQKHNAEMQREI